MTRRLLRVALAVPLLAIGLGTASAAARGGPAEPLCVQAASAHHAGIVVELGGGQVVRQCVGFDTSTITALAVLKASGIENATESYGGLGEAVCQIDNEPPSYTSCLPTSGSYWVFFISRAGGAWANSPQGVSIATLSDGDDAGFRYDPLAGADPPPVSPAGTCFTTTPTPSPTARPTPSPTPRPTPVATSPPGRTSNPSTPAAATVRPSSTTSAGAEPPASEDPTAIAAGTGQASPAANSVPVADVSPAAAISSPFTPGLLLAACVVGALVALLGVQGIRRRRR
jgi:hypothetical protein